MVDFGAVKIDLEGKFGMFPCEINGGSLSKRHCGYLKTQSEGAEIVLLSLSF